MQGKLCRFSTVIGDQRSEVIFERSDGTHKLKYTEYFGDSDSKAFNEVKKFMWIMLKLWRNELEWHWENSVKKENRSWR
jgi:hypothetical protein